ncbi:RICIN domain-containing protein [Actinosynnema sp. CS-041913]|uniref:RICIN domain-containing protein n=1 Tax=Actinosynnema sp. CS-041913 TaxID=3239917 RepID=UPI003D92E732
MKRLFLSTALVAAALMATTSTAVAETQVTRTEVPRAAAVNVMYWAHQASTTLVMDVRNRQSANGTQIQLYKHNGTTAQWFVETPDSTHSGFYIKSYFNRNKCLSVDGYGGHGALVRLWDCRGQSNQRFHRYYVGGNRYEISPEYNLNLCVSVRGSTAAKRAIEVQNCNGTDPRHKWDVTGVF